MTFVSYAQNFEDVMLWRALRTIEQGFYIDVGANDPHEHSVTKAFYERRWRGINIEPSEVFFRALQQARPEDINLRLVAASTAGLTTFYDIPNTGLSTTEPHIADRHRKAGHMVSKTEVEASTLAAICREYVHGDVHFLKIDVEGGTRGVIEGLDLDAVRPWIIVVEATEPMSPVPAFEHWESTLIGSRYSYVYFDGLNRFYLAEEQTALAPMFDAPPNVFDDFVLASLRDSRVRADELASSLTSQVANTSAAEERARRSEEDAIALRRALADQSALIEDVQTRAAHSEKHAAETVRWAGDALQQTAASIAHQSNRTVDAVERAAAAMAQQSHQTAVTMQQNAEALAQQFRLTAEAQRQSGELINRLAEARTSEAMLASTIRELQAKLVEADQHLPSLAEARQAAQRAEDLVARMRTSTSWRVTAPLRGVRRLLPGKPGAAHDRSGGAAKALARRLYHRAMWVALRVPGARPCVRIIRAAMPRPVDWLAARYRSYDETVANARPGSGGEASVDEPPARPQAPAPSAAEADPAPCVEANTPPIIARSPSDPITELSEEEALHYRQFCTRGLPASVA